MYGVRPEPGDTRVVLDDDEGPRVVTVGDDDGPGVTLAVTEDDAGGVPQMQTQFGGLVGAGVVGPAEVLGPGVVDGPDVPGDDAVLDRGVVVEPRR